MDEITIGDKIYVSSKRAAKITGYAKDYIGQLCREGRVAAKLVGRNWYVLESSIREHRFGREETPEPKAQEELQKPLSSTETWKKPQYEALAPVMVPELSSREPMTEQIGSQAVADMQSAWREWFQDKQQKSLPDGESDFKDEYLPVIQEDEHDEVAIDQPEEVVQISRVQSPEQVAETGHASDSDEEETVVLHRSYATRTTGEIIPPTSVPVVDLSPRKGTQKATRAPGSKTVGVSVWRAILIVLAALAVLVSSAGTGYADMLLKGTSINLGAQRQVIDFLGGARTIDNSI